jgi:multidrug resistance efflux pump
MAKNKRIKKIKATKDFLVAAVACGFVCLWAIRDAWFPTEKILKRHPLEFAITNSIPGVVKSIPVAVGDEVSGARPLLILSAQQYEQAVAVATEAYRAAVETKDKELIKARLETLTQAEEKLKETTLRCSDFLLKTSHGEDSLKGKVLEILVEPATYVDVGETVMVIQPADTFYIFNQTLAVLMFAGMIAALFFHRIASK